jgi:hypothetical protein
MSIRWTRVMAAAGLTLSSILVAAPARADDCAPLDVSCVAGDVVDGVENVDGVVQDTVDSVTGTVDPVAQHTKDTVNELLGGGQEDPPAGDGRGNHGGGGGNPGDHRANGHRSWNGHAGRSSNVASQLGAASRPPIAIGTTSAGAGATFVVTTSRPVGERPGLPARVAATAAKAVKSLAIVLLLLLAAIGFVVIQDRLDKKDPRLALAPLESDVVRFD